jgi:hypothetical protein
VASGLGGRQRRRCFAETARSSLQARRQCADIAWQWLAKLRPISGRMFPACLDGKNRHGFGKTTLGFFGSVLHIHAQLRPQFCQGRGRLSHGYHNTRQKVLVAPLHWL